MFSWAPQVKALDELTSHIPLIALIICGVLFWSSVLFLFRATKAKTEAQDHIRRCIHKDDKEYIERIGKIEEKNERLHIKIFAFIPSILTTGVTTAVVIIGMSIKADPLWAAAPIITFTGTSIGSIVIYRNRTNVSSIDNKSGDSIPNTNISVKVEENAVK